MGNSGPGLGRKDELILEIWLSLHSTSLGKVELAQIREVLSSNSGDDDVSPARIAGMLAEHGVRLRHAEVLKADTSWRQARLFELFGQGELNFSSLTEAQQSIVKLDELRLVLELEGDTKGLDSLRALALGYKENLRLGVQFGKLSTEKTLAGEIVEWLTLWLQNPELFATWLDLRQQSPEFLANFRI